MRPYIFFTLIALGLSAFVLPAGATSRSDSKSGSSSTTVKLSEMPVEPFSDPEESQDVDNDGVIDADDDEIGIPNPFAPQEQEDKPKKKQVYKAPPVLELGRTIRDDRIDDGYVQGLINQRSNLNNQ